MNLCTNAYHAMRETGGIRGVSLLPLEISSRDFIKNINLQPGPYLRLVDLVITDMTMPKMTGDKLALEIKAIRPAMPVILCTGFSDLIDKETAEAMGIRAYVTKPIIMQTYARTVRNVLDGIEGR